MFYRITYDGIGIYQALKNSMSLNEWKKLLSSEDINWLPKPPDYDGSLRSDFTQKGFYYFYWKTLPICNQHLDPAKIKIESFAGINFEKKYEDEYQVVFNRFSKFDKAYDNAMPHESFDDEFTKAIENLSEFKYGCLYDDGELVTGMGEINKRDGWHIIVQEPETFIKNKVGMCHDATRYVDLLCRDLFIVHKNVCIFSKLAPKYATHSFVVVLNNDLEWKVIDVFSYEGSMMNETFDTYEDAIDARVKEWIKTDNENDPDVDVYVRDYTPVGGNIEKFFYMIKNLWSRYYSKNEMKDIYENNENLLKEEVEENLKRQMKSAPKNACVSFEPYFICESTYFDDVPEELEQYVISEYYKYIDDYWFQIPISKIAEFLLNDKIKNYRNFHNFLNLLKDASGYFEFKIDEKYNYFQPPMEISKIRIDNKKNNSIEFSKIENDYEVWIKEKTKTCNDMNQVYKNINDSMLYLQDWGSIGINARYFVKDKTQLVSVIDHELGHMISFLIRVSGVNHDLCRYWPNQYMNDFVNDNDGIVSDMKSYMLDSDEFKRWCDTVVQRLCLAFKNGSNDYSKLNKDDFYNTILKLTIGIDYKTKNINNERIFNNMFKKDETELFIKYVYEDSLKNKNEKSYRNNFTSFKKWFYRTLIKS